MYPIKNILPSVIGRMSEREGISPANIAEAWGRISGGKGSRVADMKDGCLTVYADSTMRIVNLNLHREDILQQLNKDFPSIKKIYFKVGKVDNV
jgi:hypothetical protein